MTTLPEKILLVHEALARAALPHAFGGALALAWCTGRARGTIDIDVNVFVAAAYAERVIDALPGDVKRSQRDLVAARRDGQVRVWWDRTPIDLFLNTTPFHEEVARRARHETFLGRRLPFIGCTDLAVFKAFFNRGKDWVDIEEMLAAGTLELAGVTSTISLLLGADDARVQRLQQLAAAG